MRFRRATRFFIPLILAIAAGSAQAAEVAIPFTLAAGDHHRLSVSWTKEQFKGGEGVRAMTASAFIDMEVLGSRGSDLIVSWTFRDLEIDGGGPQAGLARELFGSLDGQRIEYYLDAEGSVTGVHNLDEVVALNRKFVERLMATLSDQLGNAQLAAMVKKMVAPLLTPELVERSSLEGPQLFHFFAGASLEPGAVYSYEEQLPVPGGGAIPALAEFSLRDHDAASQRGVIDWRQYPDPERSAAALEQMISAMLTQAGMAVPDELDLSSIVIEDNAEYDMDLATGLPRQFRHQRQTTILDQGQVKRTVMRLIE